MTDSDRRFAKAVIPHEVMVAILNRCDDKREFMIQMWLQNPGLARQGGAKVAALLAPIEDLRTQLE